MFRPADKSCRQCFPTFSCLLIDQECSFTRSFTPHSMKNLVFHSLLRWKMIILPSLTTSLMHLSLKGWEKVLFELESENRSPAVEFARTTYEFEMSSMEPSRIDERTFQNYDWVQTSYLPSMLCTPTDTLRTIPKLICDDDNESIESGGRANGGFSKDHGPTNNGLHDVSAGKETGRGDFTELDEAICDLLDDGFPEAPATPKPPETNLDLKGKPRASRPGKRRKRWHGTQSGDFSPKAQMQIVQFFHETSSNL